MILDYNYNKYEHVLSVSYINKNGFKNILDFNVNKFKTYYLNPEGKFKNWDGSNCDIKYTQKPTSFDIKTYFEELDENTKNILYSKTSPKLYTFDIETEISDEFPNPVEAKFPITAISVSNYKCDVLVLGTKNITDEENTWINNEFKEYLQNSDYFKSLDLNMPKFYYIKFDNEENMLKYFLKNIVSKVPILAGWNAILFDWQYIQNRIRGYYPKLSFKDCSINKTLNQKKYVDKKGDSILLMMPNHTLIIDMMDVIDNFDLVVLPIKDSLSLDYIANESINMRKIKYKGSLQTLFETDYPRYVFYNAIDSVLVQLIDKKFKTLQNIYMQALYCKEKIGACFSKIALSEALVFNDFYQHGIKIVTENYNEPDRGILTGAYVKEPIPGKHKFICCNDFASLYPSTIITCNLSFENYLGKSFNENEIKQFKQDKNYFVSVNGGVYKNDKEYTFKRIQRTLKENRNISKYLSKQLDALVITDIDNILNKNNISNTEYPQNIIKIFNDIGYNIKSTNDLLNKSVQDLQELRNNLSNEIMYYTSYEQAMKYLANSMYGGSSHVKFFWFNMDLANDITGEARNLIHMMEHHIPDFWRNNWCNMKDLHKKLGINLIDNPEHVLKNVPVQLNDPNAYHQPSYAYPVYGDTDSIYTSYEFLLSTIKGIENMSLEQIRNIIIKINIDFLDKHNEEYITNYYKTRFCESVHKFELETIALSGIWLDVKKRYAQIILWKDGKNYNISNLPLKVKGLEIVKSSYPKQARESLKNLVRFLLESRSDNMLLQRLNIEMQKEKINFYNTSLENICGSVKIQNYNKYILNDNDKFELKVAPKCPFNVRAAGNYNRLRNIYNLPGEPIYGGKVKWYKFLPMGSTKTSQPEVFAFVSTEYPEWADKYAPINKELMFQQFVLDPFNRILNAIQIGNLQLDGNIQCRLDLF